MRTRNTLILLVILVGLGAYVLLVERKMPPPEEQDATPAAMALPAIISYRIADTRALRLSRASENQLTELVYRDDGLWHVTTPANESAPDTEADQGKVYRLLESLATLHPKRELTGTVGQPADYELASPAMRVEIEMVDGVVHTLSLGARNPSGSGYYGQVSGNEAIYIIPLSLGAGVQRCLSNPPFKPTPMPEVPHTLPPRIPPPTATPGKQ